MDCLERFYLFDSRVGTEIGCGTNPLYGAAETTSLSQFYTTHAGDGACKPGIKCQDGSIKFGKVVCDDTRDCLDSSDEMNFYTAGDKSAFCQTIRTDPAYIELPDYVMDFADFYDDDSVIAEMTAAKAEADEFFDEKVGAWAKGLIALFVLGAVATFGLMVFSRRVEMNRLDASKGKEGKMPSWAKSSKRRSVAKVRMILFFFFFFSLSIFLSFFLR